MLVSFIALMLALLAQTISRAHTDDLERSTFTLISRTCLVISLVVAPWVFKFLIVVTVLVLPSCFRNSSSGLSHCSRRCVARSTCLHPHH